MHVRGVRKKQSNFMFLFDMRPVPYCKEYKYLGATINEFLDFTYTAECLADSAGRALGSIVTKMIKNGGFPFNVYSILYEACVTSIADYSGEVFGYNQHQPTLKLHLRAIRAFLGLPKNSVNVGVLSEVDWLLPQYRTRMKMIRMYNRIIKMDENRLTRKIFNWDRQLNESNTISSWSNEVKSIFSECNMISFYDNTNPFAVKCTITKMHEIFLSKQHYYLKAECETKPKLRTFVTFKNFFGIPSYVLKPLSFVQKKFISKTRLGSLPIRLETGRFSRPILEEHLRICLICNQGAFGGQNVENEHHFIFVCGAYATIREIWMSKLILPVNFEGLQENEQLGLVLNDANNVKLTSQFLIDAYDMRSKILNN